jgi:hypothetical protein
MELGILQKIDKDLRNTKHTNSNLLESNDDNVNDEILNVNQFIENRQKIFTVSTLDWLNGQVRI